MGARSKEYEQGFASLKYENPYQPGTQEYNDFERGWVQRLKQGYPIVDRWQEPRNNQEVAKPVNSIPQKSLSPSKRRTFSELLI